MGDAKIRIDLAQGIVEAEGPEEFVKAVYSDFKDRLDEPSDGGSSSIHTRTKKKKKKKKKRPKQATEEANGNGAKKKSKRRRTSGTRAQIIKDLDLSGGGKKPRLKDFYAQYKPSTYFEKNLIFVYYLTHELGLSDIGVDHVFTCYREVPVRIPGALPQSLKDTSQRRGWIDTTSLSDITVATAGLNYLEHDMPKADAE